MKAPTKEMYEEAKAQLRLCEIAIGGVNNEIRELSEYRNVLMNGAEICKSIIDLYESDGIAVGVEREQRRCKTLDICVGKAGMGSEIE